jgi:hypothetical protein
MRGKIGESEAFMRSGGFGRQGDWRAWDESLGGGEFCFMGGKWVISTTFTPGREGGVRLGRANTR